MIHTCTYVHTHTIPDFIDGSYAHFNKGVCTVIIVMCEFPLHLYVIP